MRAPVDSSFFVVRHFGEKPDTRTILLGYQSAEPIFGQLTRMQDNRSYWFPAKRVGWGWGLPTVWQGWVVMAIFAAMVVAGAVYFLPRHAQLQFVAYSASLCVLLVGVCWLKGEPSCWRDGSE